METAKEVFAVDVSIQLLLLFYLRLRKCRSVHMGFNTTFVTVLLVVVSSALLKAAFQYNFCYCSIGESIWNYPAVIPFQYNFCYCSIKAIEPFYVPVTLFQYNFCYCSIQTESHRHTIHNRFNTTFVTVLSAFFLFSYFIISQDIP